MNAQDFRSLQEAYLDVVENQQIDEASGGIIGGKTFPSKNVPEKSKPNKPSKIGKGIRKSIHSASFGLSQEKPKDIVSRHREYTDKELDTVSRSGDEPKPEKGRSRSAREFQLKVIEREKRRRQKANEQTDLYDIILSHLLDEGYADTQEQAEVIMVNMSEEWRESIVEGYKERPVEKMKKKSMEIVDDPEYKGETGSVWRHQQILKHATKSAKSRETAKRKSQKNVDKYWEKEDR